MFDQKQNTNIIYQYHAYIARRYTNNIARAQDFVMKQLGFRNVDAVENFTLYLAKVHMPF